MTYRLVISLIFSIALHSLILLDLSNFFFTPQLKKQRQDEVRVISVKLKQKKTKKVVKKILSNNEKEEAIDDVANDEFQAKIEQETNAITRYKIIPEYPYHSRLNEEEGLVIVKFNVKITGKAADIKILKSSGFKRLDESCIKAIKKAYFSPATKDGRKIGQDLQLNFNFNLKNKN